MPGPFPVRRSARARDWMCAKSRTWMVVCVCGLLGGAIAIFRASETEELHRESPSDSGEGIVLAPLLGCVGAITVARDEPDVAAEVVAADDTNFSESCAEDE